MLSTKHCLFWSSIKFLEIQSLCSLLLVQKLQKSFTYYFVIFLLSTMGLWVAILSIMILRVVKICSFFSYHHMAELLTSISACSVKPVSPSVRTLHRNKFSMNNHVKALNSLHCTLSVSWGSLSQKIKIIDDTILH